jgi:hypothetical protein
MKLKNKIVKRNDTQVLKKAKLDVWLLFGLFSLQWEEKN